MNAFTDSTLSLFIISFFELLTVDPFLKPKLINTITEEINAKTTIVFTGRTPNQLAKQIVNPKTNGNKTLQQLIEHADDGLVKAGWDPGEGRTVPPLSHEEFKKAWITWIKTGAYAPKP